MLPGKGNEVKWNVTESAENLADIIALAPLQKNLPLADMLVVVVDCGEIGVAENSCGPE